MKFFIIEKVLNCYSHAVAPKSAPQSDADFCNLVVKNLEANQNNGDKALYSVVTSLFADRVNAARAEIEAARKSNAFSLREADLQRLNNLAAAINDSMNKLSDRFIRNLQSSQTNKFLENADVKNDYCTTQLALIDALKTKSLSDIEVFPTNLPKV